MTKQLKSQPELFLLLFVASLFLYSCNTGGNEKATTTSDSSKMSTEKMVSGDSVENCTVKLYSFVVTDAKSIDYIANGAPFFVTGYLNTKDAGGPGLHPRGYVIIGGIEKSIDITERPFERVYDEFNIYSQAISHGRLLDFLKDALPATTNVEHYEFIPELDADKRLRYKAHVYYDDGGTIKEGTTTLLTNPCPPES